MDEGFAATSFVVRLLTVLVVAQALLVTPAHAARKALVIGNADYERAADLANPRNDAEDVAARLAELGFEIASGGPRLDLTRDQMSSAVREFTNGLQAGDLGVFYFAGHGAQAQGENYLIPADDGEIVYDQDLRDYAYAASGLLARLEGRPGVTSVIILDACRNNTLPATTRALGDGDAAGLAHMDTPATASTFILFAAAKGRTASDGVGRNSRFTGALLQALERPDRRVDDIAYEIRARVRQESDGAQIPWLNISAEAPVYLLPPTEGAPPTAHEQEQSDPDRSAEPAQGLLPDGDPAYAPVTVAGNFAPDPLRYRVLAGGTEDASSVGPGCRGFIARRPDFLIAYQAVGYPLHVSSTSAADTVLVVRDPAGNWSCSDDVDGVHPAVSFAAPTSGDYRIWVGVYAPDAGYPGAELLISEIEPKF